MGNSSTLRWLRSELASGSHGARWPKDEEFQLAWQSYRAYNPARIDRCKLLLEALEEHHKHKEPTEPTSATIEHVMPVTLSDDWWKVLGDKAEEIHTLYLHTIGNLTLTGYNSDMSNSPFLQKKAWLNQSHFELNKYFADKLTWGAEEIVARSKALWERAREIWPPPSV